MEFESLSASSGVLGFFDSHPAPEYIQQLFSEC